MSRKRETWRDAIAPIVAEAITEARKQGLKGRAFRRFVRQSKPYLCRVTSWGKKVWLSEVAYQLGRKRRGRSRPPDHPGQGRLPLNDCTQMEAFP